MTNIWSKNVHVQLSRFYGILSLSYPNVFCELCKLIASLQETVIKTRLFINISDSKCKALQISAALTKTLAIVML